MHPDEIRAIRQSLGLSQVEAGELLGGGPRAFTKYESGRVKPAAAVVNLLRLLEANPRMLASIHGGNAPPMASHLGVHPLDVSGEHISNLSDSKFHALLQILLHAEADANNIPADGIHVGENLRSPDGGEDGSIRWQGNPDRTAFLPSRFSLFQLKAKKIGPTEAGKEVLTTQGSVKERVCSVLRAGGHYIMLCTHSYSRLASNNREKRIREALRGAGMCIEDQQIQFRGASQVASWVNRHPAAAIWVREQSQPGTTGPFRSLSSWAGRSEHDGSPWIDDDRIYGLRSRMREEIAKPQSILRVVGLSGVGKSRLVIEALRDRGLEMLKNLALCADESEVDAAALHGVVQTWAESGVRALVIVDRCPPKSHQVLAGAVSRSSSRLSLVTIDNELPSGTPEKTMFRVSEAQHTVIEALIDRTLSGRPVQDKKWLVRFCHGLPGIAIRLARTWTESLPVAHATDDGFVDAFVLGRLQHERELVLRSATLLGAYGLVELTSGSNGELDVIARRGRHLERTDLRAAVLTLLDRGVCQRRGNYAVFQPRPVALRLAERQWQEWEPADWDEVLADDGAIHLSIRAARQLSLLNTTDISAEVVAHVCRVGGPFEGLEAISAEGRAEILSALAEIDSRAVADQIERSLPDTVDLSLVDGHTRRHLVWALEKIAFRKPTFEVGARLLLRLALAENEPQIGNNATGQFTSLFTVLAGGTVADGNMRLAVLDDVSDTDDPAQCAIVVRALIAGSETRSFFRVLGAESHGTRPALTEWRPSTYQEMDDYINGCVNRLALFAVRTDDVGDAARKGLGDQLRSLVAHEYLETVETVVDRVASNRIQWTAAMESLGHYLEFDASDSDQETIDRVKDLIAKLEPIDLQARVRFLVTEMPWDFPCGIRVEYEERQELQADAVQALALEVLEQPPVLKDVFRDISQGQQRMAHVFGEAIASSTDSPIEMLGDIEMALREAPTGERNFGLLVGFVAVLNERQPQAVETFKLRASKCPDLAPSVPMICRRLGITASDIGLVVSSIEAKRLSPGSMMHWAYGRAFSDLPVDTIAPLFDLLLAHSAEGYAVCVELLGSYPRNEGEQLDGLTAQVRNLADNLGNWPLSNSVMQAYYFEKIMKWMLGKGRSDQDARATALALARALGGVVERSNERFLKPLLPKLLSDFPEITWPIIGQQIVSGKTQAWQFHHLLGRPFGGIRKATTMPILSLPEDTLFAWCHAHPDRAPNFVAGIVPILTSYDDDSDDRSMHPTMKRLLDEFGDSNEMLRSVSSNMFTFGWSGSETTYYRLYEEPLETLLNHHKGPVRRWARKALQEIGQRIQLAQAEDDYRQAHQEV